VAPNWHFLAKDVRGVTTARREFTAHLRRLSRSEANLEAAALIFGELIANAIKYGDDPITATLERGEQYARLVIEDGGAGFSCEHLPAPEPRLRYRNQARAIDPARATQRSVSDYGRAPRRHRRGS